MNIGIQKLEVFICVAECKSITKTAQALNYTQSGVSRMIMELEKEWGVALFERTKKGVELTADGKEILPFVKNTVLEYENLREKINSAKGIESGKIRIGTFSSVATHILPKIIKKFTKDYPNIEYELLLGDYEEIERWIYEGRVDCGFLRLPCKRNLQTEFFLSDKLLAVIPENHKFANAEKFPVEQFCAEPFMLLEKGGKAEIARIFEEKGLQPNVKFVTWDDYCVMSMVESGLGISILPELILRRAPYKIVTKELTLPAERKIGVAFKNEKSLSFAARKFLEYVRSEK